MKSVVYALSCLPCALAAALGMLLAPLTTTNHSLLFLYGMLGVTGIATSIWFQLTFGDYDRIDREYLMVEEELSDMES
jgi:hypothetical protein